MVVDQRANFVRGGVPSSIASGDTSIHVSDASIYPDPANGNYNLVLWDADDHRRPDLDPDVEVVRVTSIDFTNDILSVSRGEEDTTAVSHPSTSELQLAATAKIFTDIDDEITKDVTVSGSDGISGDSAGLGGTINVGISGTVSLDGDLQATDGETIWDESSTYIPQDRLENDSMTIAGNSVSLGGSTSINHSNISNINSDDHHSKTDSASELTDVSADSVSDAHHSKYTDENAQDAVGSILNSDFNYDDSENTISLSSNSVTIEGNSVSLGESTSVNHNDLSSISSDDHHSKYTDSDARSALEDSNPTFNDQIGFNNDDKVIEHNDSNNESGAHWSDIDGLHFYGDGNKDNIVISSGYVEATEGAEVNGPMTIDGGINTDNFEIQENSSTNSLDFNYTG